MPDLPRTHLVAYAVAALVVVVLGARQVAGARGSESAARAVGSPAPIELSDGASGGGSGRALVVHVAGAVRRPGVYRLRAGARVDDAVRRAGGARRRADLSQLNLAAVLEDGRQVLVPERVTAAASAAGVAAAAAGGGAGAATAPAVPLNLNTATIEQLDTLDGVGPATAEKILRYREEHGGFSDVEELGRIPGIGERRMASLREQVRV